MGKINNLNEYPVKTNPISGDYLYRKPHSRDR